MQSKQTRCAAWGKTSLIACALMLSASLAFAGPNKGPAGPRNAAGGPHKMSRDLESKPASGMVDVIVQYKEVPTARHHQKVLGRGGKVKRDLGRFRGGAYRMPASALADLANDPEVLFVSPDRPLHGFSAGVAIDYHKEAVNAPAAYAQGLDGTGIGVAVIDSGIANVPDLNANNLVYSQDFTGSGSTADQYGHGTHVAGIIAGTGASSSGPNASYTFQGIAGNANLISLRVLDQNGAGTDSQVIAAIQEAIQLKDTYNIRVINLSLGRPVWESYTQDPLCQAVEQAWQAGITVVVAAGNYGRDNNAGTNGYGTITAPGNDPYVITVGAMNTEGTADRTDDVPASYSSKGPSLVDQVVKPDLMAPGNGIVSLYTPGDTLDQQSPSNEVPTSDYLTNGTSASSTSYFELSGTSMSAPVVSGAAALMLQQNPALTPDQIKARLMLTAFKGLVQTSTATDSATGQTFTEQADIFTVGAGELDIQAALASTALAPAAAGSALSPTAALDGNGNVVLVQNGNSVLASSIKSGACTDPTDPSCVILWGSTSVWGDQVILWGSTVKGSDCTPGSTDPNCVILWGSTVPGGDVILWGSGTLSNDVILWGSTLDPGDAVILWGSTLAQGDNGVAATGSKGNDVVVWGSSATTHDK